MKVLSTKKEFKEFIISLDLNKKYKYIQSDIEFEPVQYNGYVFMQKYYDGCFLPFLVAYTIEGYANLCRGLESPFKSFTSILYFI